MTVHYKTRDFAMSVKALDEPGTFEGYGSVFGVRDSYNEVVIPGAFVESLVRHKREGSLPLMLWQHNTDEPIGVWDDLAEDNKGLWGKGRLLAGVRRADEALILLKAGAIRGLSIGYREIDVAPAKDSEPRKLIKLDLLEVSVVSFPANRRANVTGVKSDDRLAAFARLVRDGEPPAISEFEDILREAGIPKSMAVQIASHGYAKAVRRDAEGMDGAGVALKAAQEAMAKLRASLG
jgi:HK97 family phage prohead protease